MELKGQAWKKIWGSREALSDREKGRIFDPKERFRTRINV